MLRVIAVIWLCILFSSHASAKHSAAQLLSRVESSLKVANLGLGAYSRSSIIAAVSQSLRGEEDAKVRENLNQAIVTLAVLDIGGGALLPVTEHIVEQISKKSTFQATNQAWKNYNTKIKDKLSTNLATLDDVEVKRVLKFEKNKVLRAFETDVGNLGNVAEGSKTLKYIKKAQKWLKVKSVTKVLGPIFDVVGIGLDAWSLATTIQDCTTTPATCNYGQIASSTLGIASSVVGIATFVASLLVSSTVLGPVGAVVGLVLAVGATLISLFYEPPVDYAAIARRQKFETMMELDKYSRMQLYTAHKFLLDNDVARDDLYVVNQGHLPAWNLVSPTITVQFGKSNVGERSKEPLEMKCESPKRLGVRESGFACDYLEDGTMVTHSNYVLGHAFYGFTKTAQTYPEGGSTPQDPDPPYGGSIILVNTDQVQRDSLGEIDSNLVVRGYEIRSDLKAHDDSLPYDDMVAIGKMPNLALEETIFIRTGAGNDALNIDGMIGQYTTNFENILDADLGNEGHNTLSFHGVTESSGIQGINYNPVTGVLLFRSMAAGTLHHPVGTVKNVEFVGGTPFSDVITLGATKAGENGIDFTAIKRKGFSEYVIDIQSLASQSETRHFKIIDSTEGTLDIYDDPCDGYTPSLTIKNFDSDAVSNDILYQSGKIKIYGHRTNGKKRSVRSKMINPRKTSRMGSSSAVKRQTNPCSGETPIETHRKGGRDGKELLATVTVHSKCGLIVSSTNQDGSCMAYSDRMEELDLVFYEGFNFTYNFGGDTNGGEKSDVAYLQCPESPVKNQYTLNLAGSSGDRVVVGGRFFDDCGIDGNLKQIYMFKRPWKTQNGKQLYLWELEILNNPKFPVIIGEPGGWKQRLAGVERIVNEYGDEIANMNKFTDFMNLYDDYNKVTMKTIAGILGGERSTEIQSDVLTCLQDGADVAHPDLCDNYVRG